MSKAAPTGVSRVNTGIHGDRANSAIRENSRDIERDIRGTLEGHLEL